MTENLLTKESLTQIVAEYKRQRDFSQAGVTRAEGAIMALEHLIAKSFPEAPPATAIPAEQPAPIPAEQNV